MKNLNVILVGLLLSILVFHSCDKEEIKLTKLNTGEILDITENSATVTGVFDEVGDGIISYGHCWGESSGVSVENSHTTHTRTAKLGSFESYLLGLKPNTTYFVRAYVLVNDKPTYGEEVSFQTNFSGFIEVTSPVQNEDWKMGTTQTITWTDNIDGSVKIELLRASNVVADISESTFSDGSFSWPIPTDLVVATDYSVKISSTEDTQISDVSDIFEISAIQYINISNPINSSNWQIGTTHLITWVDNIDENIKIELLKASSFERSISTGTASDGSFSWKIPFNLDGGTDYAIQITSINDNNLTVTSDLFQISVPITKTISITAPTSSSNWQTGSTQTINWTDNFIDNVKIELLKASNFLSTINDNTASDGSYSWTLPSNLVSGTDYSIRITNVNDNSVTDTGDFFEISEPSNGTITVTTPSSATNWLAGSVQMINWTDNIDENVNIDLLKNSNFLTNISTNTASDGLYHWPIPSSLVAGSDYTIRITSVIDSNITTTSDFFEISVSSSGSITVTSPTTGTNWQIGSTQSITWTDNIDENILIELYKASNFLSSITTSTSSNGSYDWTLPTNLAAGTDYTIKLTSVTDGGITDTSDAFEISILTAPADLQASAVSSSQIVLTWTENNDNETGFKIERATGVSAFSEIAQTGANATTFQDENLTTSTQYSYRIRAFNANIESDYSNTTQATTLEGTPSAPTNLTGTSISSSQIDLSWTDNSGNEDGFKIERAFLNDIYSEIATVGANITAYQNTGLPAQTSYNYRVRAYNAQGNSDYSNVVSAGTQSANNIPTISAPSTSTGTFTVTMTYVWTAFLTSSSDRYVLEESTTSPTSGFSQISTSTWGQRPASYEEILTRSTGTYYYRVRVYELNGFSPYSEVISVAVNEPPSVAYLRIVNNTHYDMIDIQLNGVQQTSTGQGILVGSYFDFEFTSGGTVNYYLGVGFWDGSSRNVWFTLSGITSVVVGNTTTITFNNPTLAQLLSGFSSGRNWDGYYFDAGAGYHTARFRFTSSGGWTLYDDGVSIGTGNVTLVSWNDYASIISFKVTSSGDIIQLAYPFGSFLYENGPASWPIIEYVAQ